MSLEFQNRVSGDILIADLKGRLMEKSQVEELEDWVTEQLEEGKLNFLFNLNDLDYINSTGLNFFIQLFTRIRNKGGELVFCCVSDKISKLLIITKLNNVFNIEQDEQNAIKFLQS